MDRLVRAIDDLIAEGCITGEVIIQSAAFGFVPAYAVPVAVAPFAQLRDWATRSEVIVTHGGPASIALALSVRRAPIVVPRDPSRGEHVDDHQIRFVRWLTTRRTIIPVEDPGVSLSSSIDRARTLTASPDIGPSEATFARLRRVIEEGR